MNSNEILRQRAFADLSVAKLLGKLNNPRYILKGALRPDSRIERESWLRGAPDSRRWVILVLNPYDFFESFAISVARRIYSQTHYSRRSDHK
jgi:hypothetical protein